MSSDRVLGSACGKVILCGEHSVVYGRPAIALPVPRLRTHASIWSDSSVVAADVATGIDIIAPDINARFRYDTRPQHPLARIVQLTTEFLATRPRVASASNPSPQTPDLNCAYTLKVKSQIPVGSHLGSGAASSMACARAVAAFWGCELLPADASALVFEIEKIHHGTPSGIDNTVIAYEQPVWFVKGQPPKVLGNLAMIDEHIIDEMALVIADTGLAAPTKMVVAAVRASWERDTLTYEHYFDDIAALAKHACDALQRADDHTLGKLMTENHAILRKMGVSCLELDHLCITARRAGAWGAKLSGGGRGGNMIALAHDRHHARYLQRQLLLSGAKRVWVN